MNDPAVQLGMAIGVLGLSALIVFILGFEAWLRSRPSNERHNAPCVGERR